MLILNFSENSSVHCKLCNLTYKKDKEHKCRKRPGLKLFKPDEETKKCVMRIIKQKARV